jgi:NitT/TauT family transport system substrate-binding protein
MSLYTLLVILLAGCTSKSSEHERVKLLVTGTANLMSNLPNVIAQQLDLYRKSGLNVEVEVAGGGTHAVQALLGGNCEVVLGFLDHPMRMFSQGRKLRAFAALTRYSANVVIVSPAAQKPIRQIRDLRGTKVGVSDLGSQNHHFINRLLVRNGLSPADITPIAVGPQASAVAALERGRIDAWSGFDPAVTAMIKRFPGSIVLADTRTEKGLEEAFGVSQYPGSTLYTTEAWLLQNPEKAKKLVHAMLAALRWIQEHTPEEIAAIVPPEVKGPDAQLYLQAVRNNRAIFSPDGVISPEGAQATFDSLKSTASNPDSYRFDPGEAYTNEFVAGGGAR